MVKCRKKLRIHKQTPIATFKPMVAEIIMDYILYEDQMFQAPHLPTQIR